MDETRFFNGVKVNIKPLTGADCLLSVDGENGSMVDGKVTMRVYTNKTFAKVRKAFPKLGYAKDIDHVTFHSDYSGQPEIDNGFLV